LPILFFYLILNLLKIKHLYFSCFNFYDDVLASWFGSHICHASLEWLWVLTSFYYFLFLCQIWSLFFYSFFYLFFLRFIIPTQIGLSFFFQFLFILWHLDNLVTKFSLALKHVNNVLTLFFLCYKRNQLSSGWSVSHLSSLIYILFHFFTTMKPKIRLMAWNIKVLLKLHFIMKWMVKAKEKIGENHKWK